MPSSGGIKNSTYASIRHTSLKQIRLYNQGLMLQLLCVARQKRRREESDDNTVSKSESAVGGRNLFRCLLAPLTLCTLNKEICPEISLIRHTDIDVSRLTLTRLLFSTEQKGLDYVHSPA